jgi:hypothetical protein
VDDLVLVGMASELRHVLEGIGADPLDPPDHTKPPADLAFKEYIKRGGTGYEQAEPFAKGLVEEVVRQAKTNQRSRIRNG